MVCIHCGGETAVTNSRHKKRLNQVWRRRACLSCGALFTTEEQVDLTGSIRVVQVNDKRHLAPFDRDKLFISIQKSCEHRENAVQEARALTATVISKLLSAHSGGTIEVRTITNIVTMVLKRFDSAAAVHYMAFHP